MEHWKNLSFENIVEEFEGVVYTEEWVEVKGFPLYLVSNFGRVKALAKRIENTYRSRNLNPKILKQAKSIHGYLFVYLYNKIGKKMCTVHRLVALNFIHNPENKPQVNHKDGNKANNLKLNLEWNTRIENINHAFKNGLIKTLKGASHYSSKKVKNKSTGVVFGSIREAADSVNLSHRTIGSQLGRNSKCAVFEYL